MPVNEPSWLVGIFEYSNIVFELTTEYFKDIQKPNAIGL